MQIFKTIKRILFIVKVLKINIKLNNNGRK